MSTENTNEEVKASTAMRYLKAAASDATHSLMQVIEAQEKTLCHLNSLLVAHSDRILQLEQKIEKLGECSYPTIRNRLDDLDAACSQRLNELEAKVGDLDFDDLDRDFNRIGERLTDLECAMDDKADASDVVSEDRAEEIAREVLDQEIDSDTVARKVRLTLTNATPDLYRQVILGGMRTLLADDEHNNPKI